MPAMRSCGSPSTHWKIALCSLSTGSKRPPAALRVPEQQLAGGDDQLFVGDRHVDAGIDGGEHRIERDRTVGGGQQDIGSGIDRHGPQPFGAVGGRGHDARTELRHLFGQQLEVAARGEAHDLEALGVARDHVERLTPDASGRTENGDALAVHGKSIGATSRRFRAGSRPPRKARSKTRSRRRYTNRSGRARRRGRRSSCRRPSPARRA